MKWYIGQEIVCIKTHEQGAIIQGKIYVIKSLRMSCCKCNEVEIDVGLKGKPTGLRCNFCGWEDNNNKEETWWLSEKRFAPLDFDISELTDILEQPKELINNYGK